MKIMQFKEIRQDGQIIHDSMKVEEIFALGTTEKIIEIQWLYGSQLISVQDAYGIFAKVVAGREFVVANVHDESGEHRRLLIINADGTQRLQLPNAQKIRNKNEIGEYFWFESSRTESPNIFGVVFSIIRDKSMFQLDIDAFDGSVVAVYPMR